MNRYEMIVFWSETDNIFVVEVPELLGCMADGHVIEGKMVIKNIF
ncbi:hypothetical protein AGMMS50276_07050 [Synergistales bacterium]|nr:hypothetical protein AGMMS50276_07050 [Synergistales bacterium]